jgi:hypothetical protein
MAVSRLDGRGFRYPEPVPRIRAARYSVTRTLAAYWARPVLESGVSNSTGDRPLAATLTRIALLRRFCADLSGGLIAGRRLSPCPQLIASHGLSLVESRTWLSGAFSYFAGHFHARRRGGIYPHAGKIPRLFERLWSGFAAIGASACGERLIAVHNLVDNLTAP